MPLAVKNGVAALVGFAKDKEAWRTHAIANISKIKAAYMYNVM